MEYYSRYNSFGDKEKLMDHLSSVAKLSGDYCSIFTKREIGEFLGYLHDAGKMTNRFQNVLNKKETNINHAIIGGILANIPGFETLCKTDNQTMDLLTDIIIAHHSEIVSNSIGLKEKPYSWDDKIMDKTYAVQNDAELQEICKKYATMISNHEIPYISQTLAQEHLNGDLEKMLFARMLLSCLVDADYSSSAKFSNKNYLNETEKNIDYNKCLLDLEKYRNSITAGTDQSTGMNAIRSKVYDYCSITPKISGQGGLYTLTAPTGSAKTLGMIKWALNCAKTYKKNRIFTVLPFLSIISQTTETYEKIFGSEYVLEDDSQVERISNTEREIASRWTHPIIVPTMVKFLETLFSSNATNLRRLHNICNSVIIFDEFQSIPPHLLTCTLNTLRELSKRYGCIILFSSASPPNFTTRKGLEWWDTETTEIVNNVDDLYYEYSTVKKLNIVWDLNNKKSIDCIAQKVASNENSCVIVNTKKVAQNIYEKLIKQKNKDECFLISTSLCSQHREHVIAQIKERQKNKLPVYVVSTQCIEAGVHISFKDVYRELAPLEEILQSSGRCARNGEFVGDFCVFVLEDEKQPDVSYRNAKEQTRAIYTSLLSGIDINNLQILNTYYERLYKTSGFEHDDISLVKGINDYDFKEVRDNYHVINNREQIRIIVPYSQNLSSYNAFKTIYLDNDGIIPFSVLKPMQKNSVTSFDMKYKEYCKPIYIKTKHHPEGLNSDFYILMDDTLGVKYDDKIGLTFSDDSSLIF